jgi:Myb-like DNA-binding domain
MNGITEPLPGLLDDPQFAITDLPALTEFHIAPLRNPAPLKHTNVPSPLEPVTTNAINANRSGRRSPRGDGLRETRCPPTITPNDVLLARESKKPHLAISQLVEDTDGPDSAPHQLPSFISLSVVEKSPIPAPNTLKHGPASKRPRLEIDGEQNSHDLARQLPRPAQKEVPATRPAPLLPAMVTGLHEPPPSAALLPSIELDKRPGMTRMTNSKIQVKDILRDVQSRSPSPSGEMRLGLSGSYLPPQRAQAGPNTPTRTTFDEPAIPSKPESPVPPGKDQKARRARRKWTDAETRDLLTGVRKYGVGKWKQILEDPAYLFTERSSVDLKDRYRVCSKDDTLMNMTSSQAGNADVSPTTNGVAEHRSPTSPPQQLLLPHVSQNKQRRKRRAWTNTEDEALLSGVSKYGFQWTAIHDDPDLGLDHRRATDLRDRIRNKFPDGYKRAESAPLRSEVKRAEKQKLRDNYGDDALADGGMHDQEKPSEAIHHEEERARDHEKERDIEKVGVTLPSLTLDDDDMDWDNRLPPLLPWDEIT